ncbi:YraN family protein [Marinitoga lauensis]|uniref:YraN family protein n=1 Tax=Marinitoga lauensis TaxID=2201189 RepID=UPI00101249EA|nr:YraN family protein [Marinitoga lauensis]
MNNKGKIYEDIAVRFLKKKGFKILKRNFATKIGEIDIIALDKKCLVFIEVKGGKDYIENPAYRVNNKKLQKIIKTANIFIKYNNIDFDETRIDVIGVNDKFEVSYFPEQKLF